MTYTKVEGAQLEPEEADNYPFRSWRIEVVSADNNYSIDPNEEEQVCGYFYKLSF